MRDDELARAKLARYDFWFKMAYFHITLAAVIWAPTIYAYEVHNIPLFIEGTTVVDKILCAVHFGWAALGGVIFSTLMWGIR